MGLISLMQDCSVGDSLRSYLIIVVRSIAVYFAKDYADMSELANDAACHVYDKAEIELFRMKNSWDVRFEGAYSSVFESAS